jgi:hypothetical protein
LYGFNYQFQNLPKSRALKLTLSSEPLHSTVFHFSCFKNLNFFTLFINDDSVFFHNDSLPLPNKFLYHFPERFARTSHVRTHHKSNFEHSPVVITFAVNISLATEERSLSVERILAYAALQAARMPFLIDGG